MNPRLAPKNSPTSIVRISKMFGYFRYRNRRIILTKLNDAFNILVIMFSSMMARSSRSRFRTFSMSPKLSFGYFLTGSWSSSCVPTSLNVLGSCSPLQVICPIIKLIVIYVICVVSLIRTGTMKSFTYQSTNDSANLSIVYCSHDIPSAIGLVDLWSQDASCSCTASTYCAPYPTERRCFIVPVKTRYDFPNLHNWIVSSRYSCVNKYNENRSRGSCLLTSRESGDGGGARI